MTQLPEAEPAQGCGDAVHSVAREPATTPWRLTQAEQRKLIRAALARDPSLPDLRIARSIGCAATTVARVREAAGVAPYRRHRDWRPSRNAQISRRVLRAQIVALTEELTRERSLRVKAEKALATARATPTSAPPPNSICQAPPSVEPAPALRHDPGMARPAQVPTQGRGLPAAVYCQECGDTRFWTDRDARVWHCAGCYPPTHGQLTYKAGGWP
jgi:hypothetical protein